MYEHGIDAKIVIMGNTGVGKTSLLQRYTHNKFDPKNTTSTTGAFFVTKKVYQDGLKVRLQLWDTAGQERFRSMAPMYYRGANAALLLYDITNAATFDSVRGWLEELKRNCSPDLIIYIVGAKADLVNQRQVTSDLARLSLHKWFPPPKPPTPPPPPTPSTFSYIRPRFTSFTSMTSPSPSSSKSSPPDSKSAIDQRLLFQNSALKRHNTSAVQSAVRPRTRSAGPTMLTKINTGAAGLSGSPGGTPNSSRFGYRNSYFENAADTDSSLNEDEPTEDDEESQEWGLAKGMDLFEVSAKDDTGIHELFDSLIKAIVLRKDDLDQQNEMTKRDSIFLSPAPAWAAQADEEEARLAARNSWSCCST